MTSPLDYVKRGWKIFPCHTIVRGACSCPKGRDCASPGKHPRTSNGVKDATDNEGLIRTWSDRWPDSNWAVACGTASGIVVIDVDPRKNGFDSLDELEAMRLDGPLPQTLQSNTGGAGRHYIFEHPGNGVIVGNRGGWLSGVDVKSDGGYVILPEAEHISGGTYTWVDWSTPIVPLPADILQMLLRTPSGGAGSSDLPDTATILQGVPEGERDNTLFRLACRLRRQLGDGAKSIAMMAILEAAANSDPPFPEDQARKCVESAWRQDHTDDSVDWAFGRSADDDATLGLTDLGNAMRLIREYGDRFRYVEGWGWLEWTDLGWRMGANNSIFNKACNLSRFIVAEGQRETDPRVQARYGKFAKDSENHGRIKAAIEVSRVQHGFEVNIDDFDADADALNCRNGVVNLRTGVMRMIDQNDLITKNTHVMYEPGFKLQAWEDFLDAATQGDVELREYLQRAAGYTLTGHTTEECFFIISGPPASGKSTFIDALHSAMGKYGTTTQAETILYTRNERNVETEIARLAGTRLVSVSEIREGASFNEALLKQITGGDKVLGRFLYSTSFEYRPQLKLWIATNHDPNARDDAIWRRLKKVAFRRTIPQADRNPQLKLMLRDPEVGGKAVLAWAVEGAMKWYADRLAEPETVKMDVKAYHAEQDYVWHFVQDCIVVSHGARTSLDDMFATYKAWCQIAAEKPVKRVQLKKALESRNLQTVLDDRGRAVFIDVAPRALTFSEKGPVWS